MARDKILKFAVLFVFNAWTLSLDSVMAAPNQKALSIVPESVDDRYDGCTVEMKKKVNNEYLPEEKTQSPFKESWQWAESCAKNFKERFDNDKETFNPKELEHDHIKAICAYSAGHPTIYDVFNKAVLTQKNQYTTTFQYHTLHFWLTDALRVLKKNQQNCKTTYRRTNIDYIGEANKEMRFGYFASSSLDKDTNPTFGDKSCFEIYTCFGAYLKSYPKMGNKEEEVLIPPYEVFEVTNVLEKKNDQNLWCDTVYKLRSTETPLNNLNCNLVLHSAENNL